MDTKFYLVRNKREELEEEQSKRILTVRCGILSKVVRSEIYGNDIVTEQHHYNTRILDVFRVRRRAHHRKINDRLLQVEGFSLAAVEHGDIVRRVGT